MKACILCGETKATCVYKDDRLEVLRCSRCGLVYQADYATALSRLNTEYESVGAYYQQRQVKSETVVAYDPDRLRRTADIRNALVAGLPAGGAVLDVGSGVGEFLDDLRRNGLTVTGVEPGERVAAFSRDELRLNVITAVYTAELFPSESFDAITFIQVMEHVENPIETLRIAHDHLRPHGLVVVDVPSYNNLRILAYRLTRRPALVKSDFIVPHNYYYTPSTLSTVAVKAGFHVERVQTGRYTVKHGNKNRLLAASLPVVDFFADRLRIGGITLYARKV